jgi:hypothetical protein
MSWEVSPPGEARSIAMMQSEKAVIRHLPDKISVPNSAARASAQALNVGEETALPPCGVFLATQRKVSWGTRLFSMPALATEKWSQVGPRAMVRGLHY